MKFWMVTKDLTDVRHNFTKPSPYMECLLKLKNKKLSTASLLTSLSFWKTLLSLLLRTSSSETVCNRRRHRIQMLLLKPLPLAILQLHPVLLDHQVWITRSVWARLCSHLRPRISSLMTSMLKLTLRSRQSRSTIISKWWTISCSTFLLLSSKTSQVHNKLSRRNEKATMLSVVVSRPSGRRKRRCSGAS